MPPLTGLSNRGWINAQRRADALGWAYAALWARGRSAGRGEGIRYASAFLAANDVASDRKEREAMKKKLEKKLVLNRETLRLLEGKDLQSVLGGAPPPDTEDDC